MPSLSEMPNAYELIFNFEGALDLGCLNCSLIIRHLDKSSQPVPNEYNILLYIL